MRDALDLGITDVESVTLRTIPGHGDQVECSVAAKRGTLTLRLIARPGRIIRVLDLRPREKRRQRKERLLDLRRSAGTG